MADPTFTGTLTGTGSGSGHTICECCCPGSHVTCTTDDDCHPADSGTFCVFGCCLPPDNCGGCPECQICMGSGEDIACALCPSTADMLSCLGLDVATHPGCGIADIDGNGVVDFGDYAIFLAYCNGCDALMAAGLPAGGPGTELTAALEGWGFKSCALCKARARQMDAWSSAGCEEHFDEIVGWISEQAKARGLLGRMASLGVPWLVREAIRRAKEKGF